MLDNFKVDPMFERILDDLIKRKAVLKKAKKQKEFWKKTVFVTFSIFLLDFVFLLLLPNWQNLIAIIPQLIHEFHLYLLIILAGCYVMFLNKKGIYDYLDQEYEALRCEVINRHEEIRARQEGFIELLDHLYKEFDINLYYIAGG